MNLTKSELSTQKQIVAMASGNWGAKANNSLDWYIYNLADRKEPKVCFLATASGDSEEYINRFYRQFVPKPALLSHLSLFKPHTADLRSFLLEQDIIYVGGGNTKNLIALWKEWQLDTILREAWNAGIILCGLSAGSICWFEQGLTDSIPGKYTVLQGLGLLSGSNCPHYDSDTERRPTYHRLISQDKIADGYATEDGTALHFINNELNNVISDRPTAMAYRLTSNQDQITENPLKPKYLGVRE
ncbi:MAG: peptidase E [Cyanobacteria bacterium J06600_6]